MSAHDAPPPAWPLKQRELQNHHMDSTRWNGFAFRDGDIVIATWAKSGTTWMQQIVAQILFNGEPPAAVGELSPWVDLRVPPREVKEGMVEAIPGRRFLKTHLPTDALDYNPSQKYIYVARDGRDAFMSLMNHYKFGNEMWYGALNESPGLVGAKLPA